MIGHTENRVGAKSASREWLVRIGLVCASILVALLVGELFFRLFLPIAERRDNITLDGELIPGFLEPGLVYRQVSNEYDALTTITAKGHRAPDVSGNPDVVFIGDSFTFGWGLPDEATFASIYCRGRGFECANLGDPGSGTLRQVERLERFLTDFGWRPREVKLFFFGMSGSFSSGNDFVDNYERERLSRVPDDARGRLRRNEGGVAEWLISMQPTLLRYSYLIRAVKFYAGPVLRTLVLAEPGEERMRTALQATGAALARLDELSRTAGFEYRIYLIVPVQDILLDTDQDTLAVLNSVSPKPAVSTAALFAESPGEFYFAFDGHLNAKGARKVADFLVAEDSGVIP